MQRNIYLYLGEYYKLFIIVNQEFSSGEMLTGFKGSPLQ